MVGLLLHDVLLAGPFLQVIDEVTTFLLKGKLAKFVLIDIHFKESLSHIMKILHAKKLWEFGWIELGSPLETIYKSNECSASELAGPTAVIMCYNVPNLQ